MSLKLKTAKGCSQRYKAKTVAHEFVFDLPFNDGKNGHQGIGYKKRRRKYYSFDNDAPLPTRRLKIKTDLPDMKRITVCYGSYPLSPQVKISAVVFLSCVMKQRKC